MTQELIPGCGIPLLAAIDPGLSDGYIVRNLACGKMEAHKMPVADGGQDLEAIRALLKGYDLVVLEDPPFRTASAGALSKNMCYCSYKELYGLLFGADIPFLTVEPQEWQASFGFPKRGNTLTKEWKWFLHGQAAQRFPTIKKMPQEAGAAYLLYDYARREWASLGL